MTPTCATCRAYAPPEDGQGKGECRRRSPRSYEFKHNCFKAVWPPVWPHWWCLEWRKKEPAVDEDGVVEEMDHG